MLGTRSMALASAAALGAGAAYFLDPVMGHTRRSRTRAQVAARTRREARHLGQRARYERGRARGMWHNTTNRGSGHPMGPIDDHVLADKVRSEVIGRVSAHRRISVDACGGVVTLRGEVDDAATILELCRRTRGVEGVERVDSLLHLPGQEPANKAAARHPVVGAVR